MKNSELSAKATRRVLEFHKILSTAEVEEKEIEFFFYSDEMDNALDLMNHLKGLHYDVQCVPPSDVGDSWLITGITQKLNMRDEVIIAWTEKMDAVAGQYYSKFDGWGTMIDV